MKYIRRLIVLLGPSLFVVCFAGPGHAQSATERSAAESLFQEGKRLMQQGAYSLACSRFAESMRIDPATGTLLNLAVCHERQGKLASAWGEYNEVVGLATRESRKDRADYARERAAAIEPKLSRVTFSLSEAAAGDEAAKRSLSLELDGSKLNAGVLGVAMPLDPGEHELEVSAPGKRPWSTKVTVAQGPTHQTVIIQKLEASTRQPEPSTKPGSAVATPEDTGRADSRSLTTPVLVAGGATIALGIGAAVSGGLYLSKRADFEQDKRNASLHRDAEKMGLLSNVLWGATAAGAVVTTVLYLTSGTGTSENAQAAVVTPWLDQRGGGLVVTGKL